MLERLSITLAAERFSSAPYLMYEDDAISYDEMAARVARLTDGRPPDTRRTLVAERTPETVVALLLALEQRVPTALLPARISRADRIALTALSETVPTDPALAFALFTSGSRGRPKGVLLDRANLVASARGSAANLGWQPDDRWLCCLPLAHIGGLSIAMRCLLAGATMVLTPEGRFAPTRIAETIATRRVTLLSLVPTMLAMLLDSGWTAPAHVRAVLLGGAPASQDLLRRAYAADVPALVTYGMTEACSQLATQALGPQPPTLQQPGHIGPLLSGVEVDIRERRIFVRGPMLLRGYLGAPDPRDARGYFDTGDLGFIDERGHLHVTGRADDTIITGGENVDPVAIEEALCSHPDVAAACVFGVPDERWGQLIAAAVVVMDSAVLSPEALADYLQQRLPTHQRPRLLARLPTLQDADRLKVVRTRVAERALPLLQPLLYNSGRPT